jgi:large repetitive protein
VSAAGYGTQSKSTTVYTGATTTVNVSMGGSTTTSTTAVVTGRVTDITSSGSISGAKVTLGGSSTTADSSGIYRFSNVAAGTYTVTAVASGYFSVSKSVTATSGATSTLNFQLATGGIITGTVTTSSGALLPGATVSLSGGSITTTVTRTTNSSGYYTSNWVPVGTYTVTVSDPGYTTQSKAATANTGATTTLNVALASSTSSIAHQATVKWAASTSTVSGYNVYRSAVSGGPYTRMNSATNTYTSYADPTVSAGQTYYYVVTAVGMNGLEGGYSSQVKAVIPTP